MSKRVGDGLSLPLSPILGMSIAPEEMNALLATRPDGKEASRWLIREVTAGSGYTAALCVRGGGWKLTGWSQITAINGRVSATTAYRAEIARSASQFFSHMRAARQ